jgi:hypothetical protein
MPIGVDEGETRGGADVMILKIYIFVLKLCWKFWHKTRQFRPKKLDKKLPINILGHKFPTDVQNMLWVTDHKSLPAYNNGEKVVKSTTFEEFFYKHTLQITTYLCRAFQIFTC